MNTTKKVMAILLVLVMVAALSVSAFAGQIVVDNVKEGESYSAYKLLEYTSSGDKYSYYLNADNAAFKAVLEEVGFVFEDSADGSRFNVVNAEDLDADSLVAALKEADLSGALLVKENVVAGSDGDAVFSGLPTGYYFVTTTTGSLCTLKTYDDQDLIVDKHEDTTVEKEADKPDANVGDTVTYTVTVHAKSGETVTLTDELSVGLTLTSDEPTIEGATVKTWDKTKDASKIEIVFDEVDADSDFVVTYSAVINDSALTLDEVNNTATVSWGDNQSTDVETHTKLFHFDISKVDESGAALEGVQFTLTNEAGQYYDGSSVWAKDEYILETDKDGMINVQGIASGTYTLTEVATLDGYNLLKDAVTITVSADGTVSVSSAASVTGNVVTVVNTSGTILPDTGSIGTTVFYILGSILVIGAGVVLVSKRRMTE